MGFYPITYLSIISVLIFSHANVSADLFEPDVVCQSFPFSRGDAFNSRHSTLIFAGLRRVSVGYDSTNWMLSVYYQRSAAYEVPITHMDAEEKKRYDTIRLFLKPEKTFVVIYQSKGGYTIIDTYQLQTGGLKRISTVNTKKKGIDVWKITDSEDGFYDASNCDWLGHDRPVPHCASKCAANGNNLCLYDFQTGNFYQTEIRFSRFLPVVDKPIINRYHCLNFMEADSRSEEEDPQTKKTTSRAIVTKNDTAKDGDRVICLEGPENFRQIQFYDYRWDTMGFDPCDKRHQSGDIGAFSLVELALTTRPATITKTTTAPPLPSPLPSTFCWSDEAIAVGIADAVLLALFLIAFVFSVLGRHAKRRSRDISVLGDPVSIY